MIFENSFREENPFVTWCKWKNFGFYSGKRIMHGKPLIKRSLVSETEKLKCSECKTTEDK